MIQTLPAVVLGHYTGWFHRRRLPAAGIIVGTAMVASLGFSTSVFRLQIGELTLPCYAALASLVVNLAVTVALTFLLNVIHTARGRDDTIEADYQEATS